ncbi:OsmC family peroxiredoxin [Sulfitobacter sp. JBTF-M27]|uniref:OsmC family peroxiredoxin n=1 Tax=Sulfitobacter sediminilitoris TaxID=2698830 RepID=A0A6P0C7F3_9RHOB|nr:OsmC family protein [Sulfitobacter sediminilitoris]NEK22109.1 OsmC family peroxiredoxin [Sulfitobacter sediminilitoris]
MSQVKTTYDGGQHCTAMDEKKGKSVAMDCPYTGKGEELSPGNLLEAALAGCMLISMGPTATREGIDLSGATISVDLVGAPPPKIDYTQIKVDVRMPSGLTDLQRTKLERAADSCPIKHSFKDDIELSVTYHYPD